MIHLGNSLPSLTYPPQPVNIDSLTSYHVERQHWFWDEMERICAQTSSQQRGEVRSDSGLPQSLDKLLHVMTATIKSKSVMVNTNDSPLAPIGGICATAELNASHRRFEFSEDVRKLSDAQDSPRTQSPMSSSTEDANSDVVNTIFPRRKAGQDRRNGEPVVLRESTLREHFSLPLKEAAGRLGISPTAMKSACRRLGIKKWPYRTDSQCQNLPLPQVIQHLVKENTVLTWDALNACYVVLDGDRFKGRWLTCCDEAS
eukprot:763527-Hanusia_phi.AAC.3